MVGQVCKLVVRVNEVGNQLLYIVGGRLAEEGHVIRCTGAATPGRLRQRGKPVRNSWHAAAVLLEVLMTDGLCLDPSVSRGDVIAKHTDCEPQAEVMMAQRTMATVAPRHLGRVEPAVQRDIVVRSTAKPGRRASRMIEDMAHAGTSARWSAALSACSSKASGVHALSKDSQDMKREL